MANKKFIVVAPQEKYDLAKELAEANGMSVNALVRVLMIRATLAPKKFDLLPGDVRSFQDALAAAMDQK